MAHERTTFFIIDRKLLDSDLWVDEPFTKGQAWVDLIGMANFRDLKRYKGEQVEIFKRGQVVTSERTLAERWHWSRGKVKRYLELLASDAMCATKQTTRGLVITLENYGFYQDVVKKTDHKTDQSRATREPLAGHSRTQKNNVNNVNKGNNVREGALPRGPYGHLTLTEGEYQKFLTEYPKDGERFIAEMDEYMDAEGKTYKNCYTALKRWAKNDGVFGGRRSGNAAPAPGKGFGFGPKVEEDDT